MKTTNALALIETFIAEGLLTDADLTPLLKKGLSAYSETPEADIFKEKEVEPKP